jgi:hypothetical protein
MHAGCNFGVAIEQHRAAVAHGRAKALHDFGIRQALKSLARG